MIGGLTEADATERTYTLGNYVAVNPFERTKSKLSHITAGFQSGSAPCYPFPQFPVRNRKWLIRYC